MSPFKPLTQWIIAVGHLVVLVAEEEMVETVKKAEKEEVVVVTVVAEEVVVLVVVDLPCNDSLPIEYSQLGNC